MTSRHRRQERAFRDQERLSGIMPLSRELGRYVVNRMHGEPEPIAELNPIAMPRRPYAGHYSPEAQAEMKRIWETPDPFEKDARDD
jgi:hypothetical protein